MPITVYDITSAMKVKFVAYEKDDELHRFGSRTVFDILILDLPADASVLKREKIVMDAVRSLIKRGVYSVEIEFVFEGDRDAK